MEIIDLTQTLADNMPVYPGDPECKIDEIHTIDKEGWRLKYLQFSSHIGTHVDALAHMDSDGATLEQLPIDRFFGEARLLKIMDDFPKNKGIAFSEGQISLEVVGRLKNAKPKFVIVGNMAVLDVEAEKELLKSGIITITDLVNMEQLPYNHPFSFYAVPLKIKDGDGSPVRAFAVLDKPDLIKEAKPKDLVFDMWLKRIERMDYLTRLEDPEFFFDIEYMLFPLLESISFNLFEKSVRYYLEELGLSSKEANILVIMFRNGVVHNNHYNEIQYEDGKISWGVQSGGGTGGITSYDPGYQDEEHPEYNMPAEKFFEYNELEGNVSVATLYLDRLVARVKHDLEERKSNFPNENIDFIIGQKDLGKKPKV